MRRREKIQTINYQLTDQDYKNILARTFIKLWWIILLFVGFLFTGGYLLIVNTANNTVQKILEKEVIKSDFIKYKEELLVEAQKEILSAKNYYISELEKQKETALFELIKYNTLPYSLTDNSIRIFDSSGKVLNIEFGRGRIGDRIYFSNDFINAPSVQITLINFLEYSKFDFRRKKNNINKSIFFRELTNEFFIAYYGSKEEALNQLYSERLTFTWLAIGY